MKRWDESAAFMVKTLLRPQVLKQLLWSLLEHGPHLPVWIGDDSPEPYHWIIDELRRQRPLAWWDQVHYLSFAEDAGVGVALNTIVQQAPQDVLILMDDDMRIPARGCDLSRLVRPVLAGEWDVLGGACLRMPGLERQAWVGNWVEGVNPDGQRWLRLDRRRFAELEAKELPGKVDCCLNFFAARREALQRCPWDEEQKVFRHEDWFKMAKGKGLKIGYHPGVTIEHWINLGNPAYAKRRKQRLPYYMARFKEKWGMQFIG